MNRNEPSGTHVLNAGGGGDGIDSGTSEFNVFNSGSGSLGDEGLDSSMTLAVGLTSASPR
jgi:hypothetical protein